MKSWASWPHRTVCRTGSIGGWPPALVPVPSCLRLGLIVKVARDRRIGSQRARDCRETGGSQDRSPSQASAQGFVPASAVGKRAEAREDVGQ
mgnify:CR=1 FL=1